MSLVPRLADALLNELATHLRIVMVGGPRQAGKTTLLQEYLASRTGSYRSLDRADTLRSAGDDPGAFAEYGTPPRVIDEVQLGGDDLVRAIKIVVDQDRSPGQFILSGSSRFLTIPTLSESLAGRIGFVDLWPLSLVERTGAASDFLSRLFTSPDSLVAASTWSRQQYVECVIAGGYPEVLPMNSEVARRAWYDGYLQTIISRDIQNFATVTHSAAIATLLQLVAARAGSLHVLTDLAHSVELARDTTRNYLTYLDTVYLTHRVPTWSANFTSRLVKSPKLYLTDSGLAAHLLEVTGENLMQPGHSALGPLLETFVAAELLKAVTYHTARVRMYHLRTMDKTEVDFVLEGPQGRLVAIEVKASTSPGASALHGLRWLRDNLGDRLHAGILLHLGTEAASRGDRIYSLPLSVLWNHQPMPRDH